MKIIKLACGRITELKRHKIISGTENKFTAYNKVFKSFLLFKKAIYTSSITYLLLLFPAGVGKSKKSKADRMKQSYNRFWVLLFASVFALTFISISNAASVSLSASQNSVYTNTQVTLTATPSGFNSSRTITYNWSLSSPSPIPTSTGNTIPTATFTPTSAGTYEENVKASGYLAGSNIPITATASIEVYVSNPMSVPKIKLSNTTVDIGQPQLITASITGGRGPFEFIFSGIGISNTTIVKNTAVNNGAISAISSYEFNTPPINEKTSYIVKVIDLGINGVGNSTQNITSVTAGRLSINPPTNLKLDAKQFYPFNLFIETGSGKYVITNSVLFNGNKIGSANIISGFNCAIYYEDYCFNSTEPGTYNVLFTIKDLGADNYSKSAWMNITVYKDPTSTVSITNVTGANNQYYTDANSYLVFTINVIGGAGPFSGTIYCYNRRVQCDSIPQIQFTTKLNQTTGLQTATIPKFSGDISESNLYFNGTIIDLGSNSPSYTFNPTGFNISFEPDLIDSSSINASNSVIDQGQISNIATLLTGGIQYGVSPYIYNWIVSYNNGNYINSACPELKYPSTLEIASCQLISNSNTPVGTYNFKLNITDSANYNINSASNALVTLNRYLSISAISTKNVIDVGQNSLLSNYTIGGTKPYAYYWSIKAPSSNTYNLIVGANSPVYNFLTTNNIAVGTYNFEVTATDSASTPTIATSAPTSIVVNSDPTVSLKQLNTIMDVGQSFTLNAIATGGTAPYSYQWNITSNGKSTLIATNVPYMTFNAVSSGNYLIGVTVNDSAGFKVSSIDVSSVTVYPALSVSVLVPSNTYMDVGQNSTVLATVHGGTGNVVYYWNVRASPPYPSSVCPGFTSENTAIATYTPNAQSVNCVLQIAVFDHGTSSYVTPFPIAAMNNTPSIVTYSTPALANLTPSNSVLDYGQSETYNVIINGGSNEKMYISLVSSTGGNSYIENINGAGDGVQTFSSFIPPIGSNTFYVNGYDGGVTTPFNIHPSSFNTIVVHMAPKSSVSASNSSINADGESTIFGNVVGGTAPFKYQWYLKAPGSSAYSAIKNANSANFIFNVSSMTTGGMYSFKLSTTDSASTPEMFNSTNVAAVAVNSIFEKPKLVLEISANIINDPDSGNKGYWALDNLTRQMIVIQTGIASQSSPLSANTYFANITDIGIARTFAGALSPNYGIVEPYNGTANMFGTETLEFNGTFTPVNTVSTNGAFIGTYNNGGTPAYILEGTYANQIAPSSTFEYLLGQYFSITNGYSSGVKWLTWGDTYNYSKYPPQGQIMTDNSTSSPSITGDIVTYTPPSIKLSSPSGEVLDYGQNVTYNATIFNGIGNFPLVNLYQVSSANSIIPAISCIISSNTPASVVSCNSAINNEVSTIRIASNGLGNTGGNTVAFATLTPPIGTQTYFASAADGGTSPPYVYSFISNSNTIQVYSDPSVAVSINSPITMDISQNVIVSAIASGGTGNFAYSWTAAPGVSCHGFTTSNTQSFTYSPTETSADCEFNVQIKDIGVTSATPHITTVSANTATISVYANLTKLTISPSSVVMDVGQEVSFSANVAGGTSPSNYVYTWYDNGNAISACTTSICVYSPSAAGANSITVNVRDSGTTTPPALPPENESASANVLVYSQVNAPVISPQEQTLDVGQHTSINGAISGGSGNYQYQWYNNTSGTPIAISGATSNTYTFNALTPSVSLADESPIERIYQGGSISYDGFTLDANSLDSQYLEGIVIYNGVSQQSGFIHAYGGYNATFTFNGKSFVVSSQGGGIDANGIPYMNVQIIEPQLTTYKYSLIATDIGTTLSNVISAPSITANVYVNKDLNFAYESGSNIITDVGLGYEGDVGLSLSDGTAPYSILNINGATGSLPLQNGIALCDQYLNFIEPSCSFGVSSNAIPGNYVAFITASDSSNGIPITNVTDAVHVEINPDINATSSGFNANVILDPTQHYSFAINAFNGTPPYTYSWGVSYIMQLHFGSFTFNELNSDSPSEFSNITVLSGCASPFGSGKGAINSTCTFVADNATSGSVQFISTTVDNAMFGGAFTPPFDKVVKSTNLTIENPPVVTIVPSNQLLDQNQYETYTISVSGGAGPFNVGIYNISSKVPKLIGNVVVASGGSNTITFVASKIGTFTYNATALDMGTTEPFIFNSTPSTIVVSGKLSAANLNLNAGRHYDAGETVYFSTPSANGISGGTAPYNYVYTATNYNTNKIFVNSGLQGDSFGFTATQPGTFFGNVTVQDSASTPESITSTNNAIFYVAPDMGPLSIEISNSVIGSLGSEIITANILGGGGTAPYTYTYKVYNAITNDNIYTYTTSPTQSTSNTLTYFPSENGFYYATVNVSDNATPAETQASARSNVFMVGSSVQASAFIEPSSKYTNSNGDVLYDSGQSVGYTVSIFGGIGPFKVELYNETGSSVVNTITIAANALGGSTSVIFQFPAQALSSTELTYNAIVTDEGQVPAYTFNTPSSTIIVNPALGSNVTESNSTVSMLQPSLITADMKGGTSPYSFEFEIYNQSNALVFSSTNSNVVATNAANTLVPTSSSTLFIANSLDEIGNDVINVRIIDAVGENEVLTNTITVTMPHLSVSIPSTQSATKGSSVSISSSVSGGIGPYTYQWYNATSGSNVPIANAISSTYSESASSTGTFEYYVAVSDPSANQIENSNIETLTISSPSSNSGGGGGGGGGSSGGAFTGGGAGVSGPTIVPFTNSTAMGDMILNFSRYQTANFKSDNALFNIVLNSLSPNLVDITVNGKPYQLDLSSPISLGVVGNSTYFAVLSNVSYIPILHTIDMRVYRSVPIAVKTNTTKGNSINGNNAVSNVSKSKLTVPTTTILPTTTIAPLPITQGSSASSTPPPSSSAKPSSSGRYMLYGAIVLLIVLLGIIYYFNFKRGAPSRIKKKG